MEMDLSKIHAAALQIFLFNAAYRVLLGPFSATSHGGMNIEPQAFGSRGHKTPFPAQVSPSLPGNVVPACKRIQDRMLLK